MTWMLVWYPCCKRRDRATQRSVSMDCHCTHSRCNHYTCDDCYHRSSKQEFQIIVGLVEAGLVLPTCAALQRRLCSLKHFGPVLLDTYQALE